VKRRRTVRNPGLTPIRSSPTIGIVAKVADEVGATANSYQILAKLAVGGMAEIFLVRGASVAGVERYCVLKRILRERAADAQFAQMFLDEARLAAQLQHPNIASVYDIGMLGDSYFFTMEYVHGETVRALLARSQELRRPVPLACALTIVAGAAAGLHHAHQRYARDGRPLGIVHRDVSPSNVMVSFEGNVKIVDFGVAKAANRAVETRSGTVKGKISYLSPEQCRGDRVDRRSDLFSLGIVMWELLTCTRLYRRPSDFDSMTAIVHESPEPPSKRRAEVPRAVDDIVLRLLAKSAGDRFQTAAEVLEAIENAAMRAGTMLSTSALSRLVRDLFGVRPEPWLEIDTDTAPHEPVSFMSRPIPRSVARAPANEVERGLASVVDLSQLSIEVLGDSAATRETTPSAGHSIPSSISVMPQAAAPTTAPVGPFATMTAVSGASTPAVTTPSATTDLVPPRPFVAGPMNTTLPWVGAPPQAQAGTVFTTTRALLAQPARIPNASASIPIIPELTPSHVRPQAAHAGHPGARLPAAPPTSEDRGRSMPLQSAWPLLAVVIVAAAVGVVVAWLSMR
jgi:serine/threonine protein kinase